MDNEKKSYLDLFNTYDRTYCRLGSNQAEHLVTILITLMVLKLLQIGPN